MHGTDTDGNRVSFASCQKITCSKLITLELLRRGRASYTKHITTYQVPLTCPVLVVITSLSVGALLLSLVVHQISFNATYLALLLRPWHLITDTSLVDNNNPQSKTIIIIKIIIITRWMMILRRTSVDVYMTPLPAIIHSNIWPRCDLDLNLLTFKI